MPRVRRAFAPRSNSIWSSLCTGCFSTCPNFSGNLLGRATCYSISTPYEKYTPQAEEVGPVKAKSRLKCKQAEGA